MKAIYLIKYGNAENAFEFKEIDIPVPAENEVQIKVHFSGLNFADVIARLGMYPDAPKNPALLGYDVAGEISAVGKNATEFKVGQKVVAMTRFGGYAEYVATSKFAVAVIPENVDLAAATILATQGCTAYYCAEECTRLHHGERILIQAAAGGVGSILVQMAKNHGCIVYGTASGGKGEYLKSLGVDHFIDYTKLNFFNEINKSGVKIDAVFDSIGGTVFNKSMKLLGPGGRMICYGAAEQMQSTKNKLKLISMLWGFGLFSPISLLMQSKSVITVNMLRIADFKPELLRLILQNVVGMVKEGKLKLQLDKIFRADQISEAHQYLESRQSKGKVVIDWTSK